MGIFIVLLLVAGFCVLGYFGAKQNEKKLISLNIDPKQVINVKYACGHPELNKSERVGLAVRDKNICVLLLGKIAAQIENDKIKNIIIEDETTDRKSTRLNSSH